MPARRNKTDQPRPTASPTSAPESLPQIYVRPLEILVAVASTGSMSQAARELGMTQSAVSQAIQQLERSLGTVLFDRSVRPPVLTLKGSIVVKHAIDLLDRFQSFRQALQFQTDQQLPMLRIGMVDSFATMIGPRLVHALRDVAAQWRIGSGVAETRIDALLERRVDFIVTSDESPVPADLFSISLLSEPYFLLLPSGHTAPVTSLRTLAAGMDLIRYRSNLYISHRIEQYLAEMNVIAPHRFQLDTVGTVLAMVEAGLGWTISTPLGFLKATSSNLNVRCLPLPGRGMLRHIKLLGRRSDGTAVIERIEQASADALTAYYVPEVAARFPWLLKHVRVAGKPVTTEGPLKNGSDDRPADDRAFDADPGRT